MLCSTSLNSTDHHFHLLQSFKSPLELKQIHAHLLKSSSFSSSSLSLTRVASVCALTPSFSYARRIFHGLGEPEIVLWNSCLKEFSESDNPIKAVSLFSRLRESGVFPDSFTLSFVLRACLRLKESGFGRLVHGVVEKLGFGWNLVLKNSILNLYSVCGEFGDARLMFDKMSERDVVTWNIMMTMFVKRGEIDSAYGLFVEMSERSVRSWTLMISGFVQCGRAKEALELFLEMERFGVEPNEATVVAVLKACADSGNFSLGRRVHELSVGAGFVTDHRVSNTLIDMYVKCGSVEEARSVFDAIEGRTVVTWSAMISGLASHGLAEEALRLFDEMTRNGVEPNGVTFVGLLHACSHMGLVKKGRDFFASMTRDYSIAPQIEHFGCMVDILSRAGLLQEAREFIRNMPIEPNSVIWGSLLGGCKVHKNVALAEEAIEQLSRLDPRNDGYFVVLSNIYAESERWEDSSRVRRSMSERGLKKTPGLSTIEIDGTVHEFEAGGGSPEVLEKWAQLVEKMELRGYVANTSVVLLDIDEDEKRRFLDRHSEKLALAFGLINTKHGAKIRIMKNLRVCEDCHSAFKVISAIVDREIVVRDRIRFHCFKDGSCSCRDYW